jgi:hypothetical protein
MSFAADILPAFSNAAPGEGVLRCQIGKLQRLRDLGMRLVHDLAVRAEAPGPKDNLGKIVQRFARVSRAIRLAIVLGLRLYAQLEALAAGAAASPASVHHEMQSVSKPASEAGAPVDGEMVEGEAGGSRLVEADEREGGERDPSEGERRPERERFDHLLKRPVDDIIDHIRRALGLPVDWDHEADEAWTAQTAADPPREGPIIPSPRNAHPEPVEGRGLAISPAQQIPPQDSG